MMENVNQGLKVFEFNGNAVTFEHGNSVMVNATEMAKSFGKEVRQWFDNSYTHDFIDELAKQRGYEPIDQKRTSLNTSTLAKKYPVLIKVVKGGLPGETNQGTWMHEDVALEFARWLSPSFAIWCNDRIKELLKHGITATQPTIENILQDPDMAINLLVQLKAERAEKQRLAEQNDKLHQRTQFIDVVFDTTSLITISQAAKVLQLDKGRNKLFETLRQKGIFYKNSNEPLQQYINSGYFKLKEKCIQRNNHPDKIVMQPFVTQKGLAFIAKTLGVVIPKDKRMILN